MKDQLLTVALQELPAAIALFRAAFAKHHPDQPTPTDEDVLAAYRSALDSSIAKDDAWLRSHQ